ncbi:Charged multivesicular body protein 1a [Porphyridium purpureum]|uniref:Charged multivesicular body protein 1a n=1 Tax=Porphyridium purpureum TaxID=35688 RepID=A0A5J4YP67_PORPP|nr:Charged multivesicular body protein 1a [Porphyridium purpureum]|eukprot:POR7988..scf222_8
MGLFGKSKKEAPAPAASAAKAKPAPSLEDTVFNMRFTAKQLARMSQKAEKDVEKEKKKCRDAMAKQNVEGARIFAENAIRQENQALTYLKLASRLDAVASKLDGQMKMQQVTGQMSDVTLALGGALEAMDVEKIARTMDTFEKQFEDLDMTAKYMDGAISDTTAMSTPQNQVDDLLKQVGTANALEYQNMLFDGTKYGTPAQATAQASSAEDTSLEARLQALSTQK